MTRAEEKVVERNEGKVSPLDVFIQLHSSKDPESGELTYPDEQTARFVEKVQKEVDKQGLQFSTGSDLSSLTPIIDAVSCGHHGGYERGMGHGASWRMFEDENMSNHNDYVRREQMMRLQIVTLEEEIRKLKEKAEPDVTLEDVVTWIRNGRSFAHFNSYDSSGGQTTDDASEGRGRLTDDTSEDMGYKS